MSDSSEPLDGPKIGDVVDGLKLVAVGIHLTFTEIDPEHAKAFKLLDEWMSGLRLYSLEDLFEIDAVTWDELLDCDYEVGEGIIDGEQPGELLPVYDVWVEPSQQKACLQKVEARLAELQAMALDQLPSGLHPAAAKHTSPVETLKLIAQLSP